MVSLLLGFGFFLLYLSWLFVEVFKCFFLFKWVVVPAKKSTRLEYRYTWRT